VYTREFAQPRSILIQEGKPVAGTWKEAFRSVNFMDVRHPYRHHLPRGFIHYRLKEWQSFQVQDSRYFFKSIVLNAKLFSILQMLFYDRESKEKIKLRRVVPSTFLRLPRNLYNSYIDSRAGGFSFRIHEWLDALNIRFDLNIQHEKRLENKRSLTAHIKYVFNKVTPQAVSLLFSERRSYYSFKACTEVRGDLVSSLDGYSGNNYIALEPKKSAGLFSDYKGFFPYRTAGFWVSAAFVNRWGQRIGFSIADLSGRADNQTRESNKNNENALWVNGELTLLPPVRITQPQGIEKMWVIQDIEGMVDLNFKPVEYFRDDFNVLAARVEYSSPLGTFNGELVTNKGKKIAIHEVFGQAEHFYLRV
jgi:hypothetical protein